MKMNLENMTVKNLPADEYYNALANFRSDVLENPDHSEYVHFAQGDLALMAFVEVADEYYKITVPARNWEAYDNLARVALRLPAVEEFIAYVTSGGWELKEAA